MRNTPGALPDRGCGPEVEVGALCELFPGVIRVTAPNPSMMTGPGTNSYVIGTSDVVVLDPGPDLPEHRARLVAAVAGRPVSCIAVTHTHLDHAPGAKALGRVFDAPLVGFGPGPDFVPDRELVGGDTLGSGASSLQVLHTPGHASNHLCYFLASEGLCFTGDHVMHGSTVVIRPPDGDLSSYLASLETLTALGSSLHMLAPGHGRLLGEPHDAIDDIRRHRHDREAVIFDALNKTRTASAQDLVGVVYGPIEAQRVEVATVTLLAHLQHLVDQGRVHCDVAREAQTVQSVFEVV